MLLTLMLTSKGVAGVPRGALVILLGTVGVVRPARVEPVFIILGIDELMDMVRTSVNVLGNCLATVVIARWEGEYPPAAAQGTAEVAFYATRHCSVGQKRRSGSPDPSVPHSPTGFRTPALGLLLRSNS